MSEAIDRIELMFDDGVMAPSSAGATALATEDPGTGSRADVVRELQARIRRMQRNRLDTRAIPTHPVLADLLPGGALAAGGVYRVPTSTLLALGLVQGPSAAGAWCAVVGMPDLGIEAAADLGLDLDRLVLVGHPGARWLAVVSALIDVVTVVLVRPPSGPGIPRLGDAAASRLASRLREREAVLVVRGEWPRADAVLSVSGSEWVGIGSGHGHLAARRVTVLAESRGVQGRPRSRRVWLPGEDALLAAVDPPASRSVETLQAVAG